MKFYLLLLMLAFAAACQQQTETAPPATEPTPSHKPKNIIFMVGDGMGLSQITAAMLVNGNKLSLERCKNIGLMKTASADDLITDSAAGATAFSIGKKSYNSAIGVDKDSVAQETILETAIKNELATGIVVTSSITHATPAAFYSHQPSRQMMEQIALDMLKQPIDFLAGGGKQFFSQRKDSLNLLDSLSAKGYFMTDNLHEISGENSKNIFWTAQFEPESLLRGRESFLPKAVGTAIQHLSKNENGFFLVVESSQIDWGGHAMDSDYIIEEMLEFDEAIKEALDFAERDGNTLVVITADHETGGYAITGGTLDGKVVTTNFISDYHTGVMVPVFAFGPQSENFRGVYENTAIYDKMMAAFGFDVATKLLSSTK